MIRFLIVLFLVIISLVIYKYLNQIKKEKNDIDFENEVLTKTIAELKEEIKEKKQEKINLEKKYKVELIEKELKIKELKMKVRELKVDSKDRKSRKASK